MECHGSKGWGESRVFSQLGLPTWLTRTTSVGKGALLLSSQNTKARGCWRSGRGEATASSTLGPYREDRLPVNHRVLSLPQPGALTW